jgi:phenylacetate-CoA ligase
VPVSDVFASTEGLVGRSAPGDAVITFASDTCIAELVDAGDQPVEDGVASAKVLVTNLHNLTQPLIRYELTDRFIRHPGIPGNGHLRATVEGRADSIFRYGSVEVHPHALRSALLSVSTVIEYQLHQTRRGLDAAIVADGDVDADTLAARLRQALRTAGFPDEPQVTLRVVGAIKRHPESGKVTRFIPLNA